MGKEAKEITERSLILWWILPGFMATLLMTLVMFIGRFKVGTPLIPELIAQKLPATVYSDAKYIAFVCAIVIHFFTGTVLGTLFIYFSKTAKIKNSIKPALIYSFFLWLIFSAAVLPLLGFGFFGKYLAGIPAIGVATLLIAYVSYGLILYLFSIKLNGRARSVGGLL